MTLTPQVQTLVDQLVQQLGLQGFRPSGIEIHLDTEGIVQHVKPMLVYRREKTPTERTRDERGRIAQNSVDAVRAANREYEQSYERKFLDKRKEQAPNLT